MDELLQTGRARGRAAETQVEATQRQHVRAHVTSRAHLNGGIHIASYSS